MIYINLIIFFSILSSALCVRPYTLRMSSYTQEYIKEFYQSVSFQLVNQSQVLVLNGSAIFSRDLDNVDVTIKATAKEKNRRPWKLLDITLELCKFIGGESKRSLSLINIVVKNLKSFGNVIPNKCPFKKGIDYHIDNFNLDEDLYSPRVPYMTLHIVVGLEQKKIRFYKGILEVISEKKN